MKRITEKAWKRLACGRIRQTIKNIEAGHVETALLDCPVCNYMCERGILVRGPGHPCRNINWSITCPAVRSCKEFIHIVNLMFYPKSQVKRLKKLLKTLE